MKKAPTFHRRLQRRLNFSQNFRKPRAFGARTQLLGAFGPQKWEYPPPTLAEKIWETTRKNRPEQGFHSVMAIVVRSSLEQGYPTTGFSLAANA